MFLLMENGVYVYDNLFRGFNEKPSSEDIEKSTNIIIEKLLKIIE